MPIILAQSDQPPAAVAPAVEAEIPFPAGKVLWLRRPDAAQVARAYPADGDRVEGRASIHCQVMPRGTLYNCRVVSESPSGHGFGGAALSLAKFFRLQTADPDGHSVVGTWIDVPFQLWPPPH